MAVLGQNDATRLPKPPRLRKSSPHNLVTDTRTPSVAQFDAADAGKTADAIARLEDIPKTKLLKLLSVSDEILERIFDPDGEDAAIKTVVRHVHELLNAECCALFLAPWGRCDEIVLRDFHIDQGKPHAAPSQKPIKVESRPGAGLTAHLADQGKLCCMNRVEIHDSPFHSGEPPTFLPSGECYSLLAIPLTDRKNRTLGLIKVENKKSKNGRPNDDTQFDETDKAVASILASKIVKLLEKLRSVAIFRDFMREMQTARSLDQIIQVVLKKTQELVYADRIDLALWSRAKSELIVAATSGVKPMNLATWAKQPDPSIIRTVWNDNDANGRLIPDVTKVKEYHKAHSRTHSQITICLQIDRRPIGVLSAESFKKAGFDEIDLEAFRLLAHNASLAIQTVGERSHVHGLLRHEAKHHQPSEEILNNVIRCVLEQYNLDAGIIFIMDYQNDQLECQAYVDDARPSKPDHRTFRYKMGKRSAAKDIYMTKRGIFAAEPAVDDRFNKLGLDFFDIQGPWVGVPLIYGDRVVGVLSVWSRGKKPPTEDLIEQLKPFNRLAAAHIVRWEGEPQPSAGEQRSTKWALSPESPGMKNKPGEQELRNPKYHGLIAIGIQAAGLERVRVSRFDPEQNHFVCVATYGMGECSIVTIASDYTRHVAETFLSDPGARLYDPTDPTIFGPDKSSAEQAGRPETLSWAVVPLIVGGELIGQIEADKAVSKREITPESLEFLTLTGSLVSQEIEKDIHAARENAIEISKEYYHSLLDNVGAYIFRKDNGKDNDGVGRFTYMNDRFCLLLGKPWKEIVGKTDKDFFPLERVKAYLQGDELAKRNGVYACDDEPFISPEDGQQYVFHENKVRLSDANGRIIGIQGICLDVTLQRKRQHEAELRRALQELHHRVKNNLAVVQSLVQLQARNISDTQAQAGFRDVMDRISTMALLHEKLYRSETLVSVRIDDYLESLATLLQRTYEIVPGIIKLYVDVVPIPFDGDCAMTCGLIVSELVSNAYKHAFPNGRQGTIRIALRKEAKNELLLSVGDDGVGMKPIAGLQDGETLGLTLVRSWAKNQLQGRASFHSDQGTNVNIHFPLTLAKDRK